MAFQAPSPVVNSSGKTRLRESLERAKKGEGPSVGQWLEFPGYALASAVASLGEDWVLIDTEHGNITDNEMALQIAAVASAGASPMVRVTATEPWMMKRALDAGAHAIMVPMCETKEQAEEIVGCCKYLSSHWPQGHRPAGAMFAPPKFLQTDREYFLKANDNIMVCVQIESRKAVENIEQIAAIDGIDMLFVGPFDLAASMGHVPFDNESIPEVQEAIAHVLKVGLAAGKYVGHFAANAELAADKIRKGFHFVNCGADLIALPSWMSNEMGKLKNLLANDVSVKLEKL